MMSCGIQCTMHRQALSTFAQDYQNRVCITLHNNNNRHGKIVILQLNHDHQKALDHKQKSPVVTHQCQQTNTTHSNHSLSCFVCLSRT